MHVDVFKRTSDDWFPSFKLSAWLEELVEVSFIVTEEDILPYCVCAWGAYDCGMEKYFSNEDEAWACFLEVIGYDDVTMKALDALGFASA